MDEEAQQNGRHDLLIKPVWLWGYLKDRFYKTKPQNLTEIEQLITDLGNNMQREYRLNVKHIVQI